MKTKYWLIASGFFLLSLFLTSFMILIVPMEFSSEITPVEFEQVKNYNWNIILGACLINLLSIAVIFTTYMCILPKAELIDNLQQTIDNYNKKSEELEETRAKLINKIEKE